MCGSATCQTSLCLECRPLPLQVAFPEVAKDVEDSNQPCYGCRHGGERQDLGPVCVAVFAMTKVDLLETQCTRCMCLSLLCYS